MGYITSNGGIQNIEPEILEMYMLASPNISPRTKTAFKKFIEYRKRTKIANLENELQSLTQQTMQIMDYAKQLESMNGQQSSYLKNLESEFSNKINIQNKIIGGLTKDLDKYKTKEVSEGEQKSLNATAKEIEA